MVNQNFKISLQETINEFTLYLSYLEESLQRVWNQKDENLLSNILYLRSQAYYGLGSVEEALSDLDKSIKKQKSLFKDNLLDDLKRLPLSFGARAEIMRGVNIEKAIKDYTTSLSYLNKIEKNTDDETIQILKAKYLVERGVSYFENGQPNKPIYDFYKAESIFYKKKYPLNNELIAKSYYYRIKYFIWEKDDQAVYTWYEIVRKLSTSELDKEARIWVDKAIRCVEEY